MANLPRQSAAPARAAIAMSLNLNGSSSPFPSQAASRLYLGVEGCLRPTPCREKAREFCVPPGHIQTRLGAPAAVAQGPELPQG